MTPGSKITGNPTMEKESVSRALRWAVDEATDAPMAAADWLAQDIDPDCNGAIDLLSSPNTTLTQLIQAKGAYKTMRIVGETASDRRLAARLYLLAIAAALVRHGMRISEQSDKALKRNLESLLNDIDVPEPLKSIAGQALSAL